MNGLTLSDQCISKSSRLMENYWMCTWMILGQQWSKVVMYRLPISVGSPTAGDSWGTGFLEGTLVYEAVGKIGNPKFMIERKNLWSKIYPPKWWCCKYTIAQSLKTVTKKKQTFKRPDPNKKNTFHLFAAFLMRETQTSQLLFPPTSASFAGWQTKFPLGSSMLIYWRLVLVELQHVEVRQTPSWRVLAGGTKF